MADQQPDAELVIAALLARLRAHDLNDRPDKPYAVLLSKAELERAELDHLDRIETWSGAEYAVRVQVGPSVR